MAERSAALVAVIPARIGSTRFPEKPLAQIAGVPMITRVVERVRESRAFDHILVATDEERIANAARNAGADARMTDPDLANGTLRCHAALCQWEAEVGYEATWVVNVQGDEPLIDPALIDLVAKALLEDAQDIATCGHAIDNWEEFKNPNVVKIAMREDGEALYFSRAPIPYPRDAYATESWPQGVPAGQLGIRHIGLYAYRARFLKVYQTLPPARIEVLESLEQLRALANGFRIKVCMIQDAPLPGVDTAQDLEKVRALFGSR